MHFFINKFSINLQEIAMQYIFVLQDFTNYISQKTH